MPVFRHLIRALAAGCLGIGSLVTPALAQSGLVNWGPWRIRWEVADNAGIGLRDVRFNNRTLLYRADGDDHSGHGGG